ncbi:LysR family transcriptional regulator [Pseudomonas plecoglossicida]|uniref:LysR family transcriptional regulator n=2 Tax=Pseudomonas TaxID=286 RepID=A0A0B5KEC6_PSEDL|nr:MULTISPECIES: LysR family transcriptional regulator [Pseudomonas]MDY4310103.1 LysR family transcriptional regulator [Pseudomonas putida]AJG13941.1 LysR family transcriptional regulator [Pseudomonas plecoglossicida]ESW37517.1 LysR family transcriptional regulator [Pseudomonas taiwanensis SJ9]MBF8786583.1 LysR family transcriptional regulator [Pseudomonas asiatica]MDY4319931.1 LysR family transcriptional regulator [Pseudomonas putida]
MIQLHDVDLKLLRVFTTIVRCGGFSAAQAALNAGQSTISEQMSHLETRLGVKLCQRGRSGFRLTEQGVAIHEATLRLLSAVESFCMDADVLKQHISGKLNLGIIDSTLTDPISPLPRTTQRFVSRGHDAHLHIYIGAPAELEERVLDGRLHLAIGHFPLRVAGLSYQPLYDEALGLYCGRRHPLFASNASNGRLMEDVRQSRIVVRGYMQQYDLEQLGITKADATVENIEAAAILIISGAYIGFLPVHFAEQWIKTGDMRRLGASLLDLCSPFDVVTRRGVSRPPILQAFLEDLDACASQPGSP